MSADDELSGDDAAILALESAAIAGHTLKLLVLEPADEPLDLETLRASVDRRATSEPRAHQRVELGPDGRARWVQDDAFDIASHVGRSAVTDTDGEGRVARWRAASALMAQRLDHRRPLWRLDVIGPFADGREAIIARIHHAMADGISCVRFLSSVLWDTVLEDEPARSRPAAAAGTTTHRHGLGRLTGAVRRELGGRADETPLDRHIGSPRALAFAFLPLAELRQIGITRPSRATVNDVLLAIAAGALAQWDSPDWPVRRHLRVQVPVSLHHRDADERGLGNRDSFLNVDLPVGERDPLARLDLIRGETARRKQLGDAEELYNFFHALARFRRLAPTLQRLASGPREFSLSISNVPGPRDPITVAGRRVEHFGSAAEPADRHALRISAISCAGTIGVGMCTDPDVLPGVEELAPAFEHSYDELREACR